MSMSKELAKALSIFVALTCMVSSPVAFAEGQAAPAEAKKEAPAEVKKEAPAEAKKEAPAEAKKEAPAEAKKEAPAEAKKEAPAEAKKEAPAEAKKEVPAEEKKEADSTLLLGTQDEATAKKSLRFLEKTERKGWLFDRLEVGWRIVESEVDDDSCWDEETGTGFLGTMAYFEEKDDRRNSFIIAYHLTDWFGLSATWDEMEVIAYTHTEDNHIDGNWKEHGPTVTAVFSTPKIFGCIVPYAEAGLHFPSASYAPEPWWTLGYPSKRVYEMMGEPTEARKKYRRIIDASETDSTTFAWGVGVKVYLFENVVFDVAYRHIDVDESAHFYLQHGGRTTQDGGDYSIPLSYKEVCAGIRWAF